MAVEHVPHRGGLPSGSQPESAYSYVRLAAALSLMSIGMSGMYAVVVALKLVALEFGVSRGIASLPYTLAMSVAVLILLEELASFGPQHSWQ